MKTKHKKKMPAVNWTPKRRAAHSKLIKERIAAKKAAKERRAALRVQRLKTAPKKEIVGNTTPVGWATAQGREFAKARSKKVNFALATLAIVEMHLSQGRTIDPRSSVAEIVGEAVEALSR